MKKTEIKLVAPDDAPHAGTFARVLVDEGDAVGDGNVIVVVPFARKDFEPAVEGTVGAVERDYNVAVGDEGEFVGLGHVILADDNQVLNLISDGQRLIESLMRNRFSSHRVLQE